MHATQKPTCRCRAMSNFASDFGPLSGTLLKPLLLDLTKVIQWEMGRHKHFTNAFALFSRFKRANTFLKSHHQTSTARLHTTSGELKWEIICEMIFHLRNNQPKDHHHPDLKKERRRQKKHSFKSLDGLCHL